MDYSYTYDVASTDLASSPWLAGMAFLLSGIGILIGIIVWVYTSYAFMVIAQKTKYPTPGIAWIPGIGPMIIAAQVAKMHWWPILLILLFWIPFVNFVAMIVLVVYMVLWMWKVAEARKHPGWWGLLASIGGVIPIIGQIVALVFLGMIAWNDQPTKA